MSMHEFMYKLDCLRKGGGALEFSPLFKSIAMRQASFLRHIYDGVTSEMYQNFLNKQLDCSSCENTAKILYLMLLHPPLVEFYLNQFKDKKIKFKLNYNEWLDVVCGYINFIDVSHKTDDELHPIITLLAWAHSKCPLQLRESHTPMATIYNYFIKGELCEGSSREGDPAILEYIFEMSSLGIQVSWNDKIKSANLVGYTEIDIYVG